MAMNLLPVLLLGGAAFLLIRSQGEDDAQLPKEKTGDGSTFKNSDVGQVEPWEVAVSPDGTTIEVGGSWYIRVLDKWLDERREAGLLMTKQKAEGWWYTTFVSDPESALGYVFSLGDEDVDQQERGEFVYSALWGAVFLGTGLRWLARRMTPGFLAKSSRVGAVQDAGRSFLSPSAWEKVGTAGGVVVAGAELSEGNVDLAASTVEAFSDFMQDGDTGVMWFGPTATDVDEIPVSRIPETEASMAFGRTIAEYIFNFQMRTFDER